MSQSVRLLLVGFVFVLFNIYSMPLATAAMEQTTNSVSLAKKALGNGGSLQNSKTSQMVMKNPNLGGNIPDPNAGPSKISMIYPTANAEVKGAFDIKVDARGGGGATQVHIDYQDGFGWKSVGSSNAPQGTIFTIHWDTAVLKFDGNVNFAVSGSHKDGSTSFVISRSGLTTPALILSNRPLRSPHLRPIAPSLALWM